MSTIGTGFEPGFLPAAQWRDENFDPLAVTIPGNNDAPVATAIAGTNLFMAGFPDAATTEVPVSGKELNHDWLVGSSIYPHAHIIKAAAGTGNVRLGFEYRILQNGSTPIYGDLVDDFAVPETALTEVKITNFTAIDLSAVTGIGAQVTFRFYRLGAHANDTYAGTILVASLGWHYQVNSNGSRTIGAK